MAKKKDKSKVRIVLPERLKLKILGILIVVGGAVVILSLLGRAGSGGRLLEKGLDFLFGRAAFLVPLALLFFPLVLLKKEKLDHFNDLTVGLTLLSFIILISGVLKVLEGQAQVTDGGKLGLWLTFFPLKFFGPLVTEIILGALVLIDVLILFKVVKALLPQDLKLLSLPSLEIPFPKPKIAQKDLGSKINKKKKPQRKKKRATVEPESEPEARNIPIQVEQAQMEPVMVDYESPPLKLLAEDKGGPSPGNIKQNSKVIEQTFEEFGIQVQMGDTNVGPTVTQYTLEPAPGIKLSKVTALNDDLALALASHPVRIEAPIPGKSLVGVEVPNRKRAFVRLRKLVGGDRFKEFGSSLTLALGRDVAGIPVFTDLSGMPHLLVAGSTGAGKTVCLNAIITSLLYQNPPRTLRLVLVDPKRVEFTAYKELPHLLSPVIYKAEKTVNVLNWLINEMERRFELLSEAEANNITAFNKGVKEQDILPFVVVVIDELADLMAAQGKEMEEVIVRLAQMARAVGIHLVIATQRPSVDVLTGLIKANITSRICFQVATQVDSRTVLDQSGAEKLLGLGDMLLVSSESSKPKRIQGVFVSQKEVEQVTDWIKKKQGELEQDQLGEKIEQDLEEKEDQFFFEGEDSLYPKAKKIVLKYDKGSASLLQRKLSIGYARAARLIDMMEREEIVGPPRGSKARKVIAEEDES